MFTRGILLTIIMQIPAAAFSTATFDEMPSNRAGGPVSVGAAFGQTATATLSGTVTDEAGAVIAGATVKAANVSTAQERQTTTNHEGGFTFSLLPPGTYDLTATREGFSAEVKKLTLQVGDQVSLHVRLKVGGVGESLTIVENADRLQESPAVGTIVNRTFLENLPLNGRSLQSLIFLAPGAVPTPGVGSRAGQISVNGQRESANYFTIDGVSANVGIVVGSNPYGGGGQYAGYNAVGATNSLVAIDALQEFKIQTSTFAPEYGRTPGAQVSLITRSGTNEFHGALFEYFRNEALDANDWFANRSGLKKLPLRQNQFGGVLGGPLFLPRFGEGGSPIYNGRNRTFFFFAYEGLKVRQPQVSVRETPSLSARQRATGAVKSILQAFPVPNGREFDNDLAQFTGGWPDPSNVHATSLRVDHNVGSKLTIFGRYSYSPSERQARSASLAHVTTATNRLQTFTGGVTFTASSHVTNDFRLNYSRNKGSSILASDGFGGGIPLPDSAIFPSFASSLDSQISIFLAPTNSANTPSISVGSRSGNSQRQYNFVDTLAVVSGSHHLKFGVDYRWLEPSLVFADYQQSIFFNNVEQARLGRAGRVSIGAFKGSVYPRFSNLSLFVQDNWRITPRLTLTYGLRYEVNPPPSERNSNDLAVVQGLDNPATSQLAPRGTKPYQTTYNNVAPRLGVAYQASSSAHFGTAIRGGFGVFYDLSSGQLGTAYDPFRYPYSASRELTNRAYPLSPEDAAAPVFSDLPPYRSVVAFAPDLKLPYTLQWNVTVEQSLGTSQTVSAAYVAAVGRRLYYTESFVRPNAVFNDLDIVRNAAYSDYHSLQLQFQRRLSRGLQALASYTWSHSIDTGSTEVQTGNLPLALNPVDQNRASSDFDRRHSLNVAVTYNPATPRLGAAGRAIFKNWAIDGIYRALSAAPVNIFTNLTGRDGSLSPVQLRPDLVPGEALYINDPVEPGGRRINREAFTPTPAAAGRQGNFGRNVLRGFGLSQLDFTLRRQFNFNEGFNAQFRIELFNAFNQANFADPIGNLGNNLFGLSTQMLNRGLGGLNALYQIGGPRSIQLGLKLQF